MSHPDGSVGDTLNNRMALVPGTRLGPYEIVSLVGAGGMGEVYKARDTRLDRTVAIKILPPTLAADPQFRKRFDREARTISQLDHPHICALYDVGEQGGTAYLVMHYLEGETLADRLKRGPLPLDQALTISIQITDALNKAHHAGIVHRDLKPANIFLTKSGAKLLDFGLAKAHTPAIVGGSGSALPTTILVGEAPPSLTAQGTILGTLQYMAPEQIEVQEADARTDIFAFGAVLYEMLTARKAFTGKTRASLISSILKDDPPHVVELQPLTPSLLDHVVSCCLAKQPEERWQSAKDLMRELQWLEKRGGELADVGASSRAVGIRRIGLRWGLAGALTGLIVGGFVVGLVVERQEQGARPVPPEVTRLLVSVTPAEYLRANPIDETAGEGRPSRTAIALSPDGRSLVFSAVRNGRQQLWLRALDQLDATPIAGSEDGDSPFLSPDGKWVGFWANGALRKVALAGGGPATTICETPGPVGILGASWGSNGAIVFARREEGLSQVSAAGGLPRPLTTLDAKKGEVSHRLPQMLPGNQAVVFTVTHYDLPRWEDTQIVVQSLVTGERKVLGQGADARYVPTGHLVYARTGTLIAVPFDVARLEVTGGAVSVIGEVMQAGNMSGAIIDSGASQFSVSATGTLVYVPGGIVPDRERSLVWVDRTGAMSPLPVPLRAYYAPHLSPDGQKVLVWTSGTDRNVWIYDLARETFTRVTNGRTSYAIWTPDGKRITFRSGPGAENLFWTLADGSGAAERLTTSERFQYPSAWSPDGQSLAFVEYGQRSGAQMWTLPLSGDRQPRLIRQTQFFDTYPEFSPDGRWLAYVSNETGRNEVYVQPYQGSGPKWQISKEGGGSPAWARSGRELFYLTGRLVGAGSGVRMMLVPVTTGPMFSAGASQMLFDGRYTELAVTRGYDVTADGRRFLMVQTKERPPVKPTQMIVVQNWFEELRQRVPTK